MVRDWNKFIQDAKKNLAKFALNIHNQKLYLIAISSAHFIGVALCTILPAVRNDEVQIVEFSDDINCIAGALGSTSEINLCGEGTYMDHSGYRYTIHCINMLSELDSFKKTLYKLALLGEFPM